MPNERFSAPPELYLPIASLVPIQAEGVSRLDLQKMAMIANLPPVEAVLYEQEGHPGADYPDFLLVDGTHRTYLAWQQGAMAVRAKVALLDEHVPYLESRAVKGYDAPGAEQDCTTIREVRDRFEQRWRPWTRGIKRIPDLRVHGSSRQVSTHAFGT